MYTIDNSAIKIESKRSAMMRVTCIPAIYALGRTINVDNKNDEVLRMYITNLDSVGAVSIINSKNHSFTFKENSTASYYNHPFDIIDISITRKDYIAHTPTFVSLICYPKWFLYQERS